MATRRERVVLELEDQFTTGMARAAASAALLNKELDSLSRDSIRTQRSMSDIDSANTRLGRSAGSTGREVDKLSGRMRILADVAAVLGPSLVPIGAVAVPAVTGLAAQLGFAATAGATAILAFQGIGDTLKALNAAALDPTKANLEKAQIALEQLSPQAQEFVAQVGRMIPELQRLRDVAAAGLFPGATEGLVDLQTALPKVQRLVSAVSTELGSIAADAGASLASDKWTPFLDFVAAEAPRALADMATAAGNTAHAVASLWIATNPLNEDFSAWLVRATRSIDQWASSLSKTQGFADFVAYVETTGPQVAETLGAIANAAIQIVQATAPLGGPVLQGLEALANVVAAVADSDLGTPLFAAAAGMALFNRTLSITRSVAGTTFGSLVANEVKASAGVRTLIGDFRALARETSLSRTAAPIKGFIGPLTQAQVAGERLRKTLPALAKTGALLGGVAVAATGAADGLGLTNATSLALAGSMAGPLGAAVGGTVGLLVDAKAASKGLSDSLNQADLALKGFDTSGISDAISELQRQREDLLDTSGFKDFFSDLSKEGVTHPFGIGGSAVDEIDEKIAKLQERLDFSRARAEQDLLADGFRGTASGIDSAASSTQLFRSELEQLNAVLTGRASFRQFEQAIDDFASRAAKRAEILAQVQQAQADLAAAKTPQEREAAQQRIKDLQAQADALKNTLDIGTQAGRDTQAALDNIATTALKVAEGLDPIARTEFLAGARTEFVKAAIAAGNTREEAEKLADQVLGLSKIVGRPKIIFDASGAWRVINDTEQRLRAIRKQARDIPLTFRTRYLATQINALNKNASGGIDDNLATPWADGGWTGPGSKYQPAGIVHAEEFVVKRGPAAAFRPWLESLNKMPGYADGGMVQRFPAAYAPSLSFSLSDQDVSRIAGALLAAKSTYGDVYMQPHNYNEFRREMEMDRQRSAGDGIRRG